jgi:hypothetical protein
MTCSKKHLYLTAPIRFLLAFFILPGCSVYNQNIINGDPADDASLNDAAVSGDSAQQTDGYPTVKDGGVLEDSRIDSSADDAESGEDTAIESDAGEGDAALECDPGYDDCDDDPENGCETSLVSDANHCGGCGNVCLELLSHTERASCTASTCRVIECESGWEDCDGEDENGCEHNTIENGPCLPTSECVVQSFETHDYYFCSTAGTWSAARSSCNSYERGDLVSITSVEENDFVQTHITENSWIGARDALVEGLWYWEISSVPFWRGQADGEVLLDQYENWSEAYPNDSAASQNCLKMLVDGSWRDADCAAQQAFVCEVSPDECPDDPDKYDPGQCGCDNPDTDEDGDGFAVCNDACDSDYNKLNEGECGCGIPDVDTDSDGYFDCNDSCASDPNKQDPGQCGCGVADTDSDSDGTADCIDGCPSDPTKADAGQCGCGVADTDSDSDGTANCIDGCPLDPTHTGSCLGYTPVNFDPSQINWSAQPSTTLNCGTTTVDTTDPDGSGSGVATITNWCGTAPTPLVRSQASGPDVVILPLHSLTISAGNTLRLIGSRPIILAADGAVSVNGVVDASASGTTPGPGGSLSGYCNNGKGDDGESFKFGSDGSGSGGGGGGFEQGGGDGGHTEGGLFDIEGGDGGGVEGNANLTPLRGGCSGGGGGTDDTGDPSGSGGPGGGGGGAVQISAGTLSVGATGIIAASGGGGRTKSDRSCGGGGGGSGGAILLESTANAIDGSAWITVNGGGGGAGAYGSSPYTCSNGNGSDGIANSNSRAPGGAGCNNSGSGGGGGTSTNSAVTGSDGHFEGGGGGGGGHGRIRTIPR